MEDGVPCDAYQGMSQPLGSSGWTAFPDLPYSELCHEIKLSPLGDEQRSCGAFQSLGLPSVGIPPPTPRLPQGGFGIHQADRDMP